MSETLAQPDPPTDRTTAASASYAPPAAGGAVEPVFRAAGDRYEVGPEIARGGMGAVHRGTDAAFGREVAVKLLLHGQDAASPAAARFFDEARIAGRLQHPGIPPVYDVGTLPDGRPFLAMKLIHGKTLDAALRDGDRIDVPAVFEGVCQAVGYAHDRGVVHRDLKPANVMVGPHGEVQVMDWGLAKLRPPLSREAKPSDPDAAITTHSDSDDTRTRAGSVMGSPPYMPPEQARGLSDEIDERSDVFGLGGILCALLTGRPVYTADTGAELLRLAAAADTAAAFGRLERSAADPELAALCRRCLAADRAARPADGNAVANEVAALRRAADERARRAEQERAAAVVRAAEERKRRRQRTAAAAAVVAALAIGAAAAGWQAVRAGREADRARQAEAEAAAREAEAVAARDVARDRFRLAADGYNGLVFGIQEQLRDRPGTAALRRGLLRTARAGLTALLATAEADRRGADRTAVWARLHLSDIGLLFGDTAGATAEAAAAVALASELAAANPADDRARWDLGCGYERVGNAHEAAGDRPAALAAHQKALELHKQPWAGTPTADHLRSVSVGYNKVGGLQLQLGRPDQALDAFRASLPVAKARLAADPKSADARRDVSFVHNQIGRALTALGRPTEAVAEYRVALAVERERLAADPRSVEGRRDVANTLDRIGEWHFARDEFAAAATAFGEAHALRRRLAADDPTSALARQDLSVSLFNVGKTRLKEGDLPAAVAAGTEGLTVCRQLADADPSSAVSRRGVLLACFQLGQIAEAGRDYAAAAGWYEQAVAAAEGFVRPEAFTAELGVVRSALAACRSRMPVRETAPVPRALRARGYNER